MKIAIFNGLTFHFEMYGYILHYCVVNGHSVTVYTQESTHGWQAFYMKRFPTMIWKSCSDFISEYASHDYIFLTTDDDRVFPLQNAKHLICIDHNFAMRRPSVDPSFHIATRPFVTNYRKWAIPCYPIVHSVQEKVSYLQSMTDGIHIAVIGGRYDYDIKQLKRIKSTSPIILHLISRHISKEQVEPLTQKYRVCIHENISTDGMMDILYRSKYVLCDVTTNMDHIQGKSMSGCIPMAFSTLNILLFSTGNNMLYKFTSAKTFSLQDLEPITLTNTIDEKEIQSVYEERERLISMFHGHVNDCMTAPPPPPTPTLSQISPWTFRV